MKLTGAQVQQSGGYSKGSGHIHANGGGWVADSASVADSVYVGPDAMVLGNATLTGNVRVEDHAIVANSVTASDQVIISGHAVVDGGGMIIDGKGTLLINGSQTDSSSLSLTPLAVMSAAQDDYAFLGKGMTDRNFKGAVDYMNFYFKEVEEPQLTYSGSEAVDNTDPGVSGIRGDVNADGQFSIADLVMMQKYLIRGGTLTDWQQGDLYEDGVIDAKDLVLMRRMLSEQRA